jgi:hypothetical protein
MDRSGSTFNDGHIKHSQTAELMGSSRNMTKFSISNLPSLSTQQGPNNSKNPPKYRIVREKNSTSNDLINNSSTNKINTRKINPSDLVFSNK